MDVIIDTRTGTHTAALHIENQEHADAYAQAIDMLINEYIPYVTNHAEEYGTFPLDISFHGTCIAEREFWRTAIFVYGLTEPAAHYADALIQLSRNGHPVWLDEENPAARNPAFHLAAYESTYLPLYTRYITWHDMEHEVFEAKDMYDIITQYGWCDETLDIAAVRAGIACGQHGLEQFAAFTTDMHLRDYLLEHNLVRHFILERFLVKYLHHYGEIMKADPGVHWPLAYALDSLADLTEALVEGGVESDLYQEGAAIIEQYYETHHFVK
ncbi:hypothetical protein [Aneurinibacillus sp. REN35]|uniref:hypothetical protein n=1 Tax=Aneurinibacillus sp. REN35 TaxID=3237286 RepID=UPI003529CB6D